MNIDNYYEESYESDEEDNINTIEEPIKQPETVVISSNESSDESEKMVENSSSDEESVNNEITENTEDSDSADGSDSTEDSDNTGSGSDDSDSAEDSEDSNSADDSESPSESSDITPVVITRGRQRIEKKDPPALIVPESGKNKNTPSKKLQEISQSSESDCSSEQIKKCEAIIKTGVNKNKQCTHPPIGNAKYCKYHNKK